MIEREVVRRIQLAGLSLLHRFDEICRKYDIQYFACDGTLLGAIRHNGYIPWDDDLDIGILRDDYERLMEIPSEEWGETIELISPDSSALKHDKIFPRVYLKHSIIQSYVDVKNWINPSTGKAWSTSLMLDLFVFDYIPNDCFAYKKILKKTINTKKWYKFFKLKTNIQNQSLIVKTKVLLKQFGKMIVGLIDKCYWRTLYDSHVKMIKSNQDRDAISCYYDSYYYNVRFAIEDIFPLSSCEFEDMTIPIPSNYTKFLEKAYGKEYMKFPPESDRYHINFIYVDLGNGEEIVVDPIKGSLGYESLSI